MLLAAQRIRRGVAATLKVPLWRDDRTHRRSAGLALGILTPVFVAVHLTMLRAAEGRLESGLGWAAAAVALVVVVVGNIWPKQAPALPDLLRARLSPRSQERVDQALEAQRRRLRPTGVAMVLLGLLALACAWSVPPVSLAISLLAVLVMGAIPLATLVWVARNTG
jgi:K+ transporter